MATLIGKYEILEWLGAGATAEVYHARDTALGRDVALKLLKPALIADVEAFQRFMREAQSAAVLFHDHIATVLDMGEAEGRYFLAMRYVSGASLEVAIHDHRFTPLEVTDLARQIGSALDYAHQQGFLHRDVKPSNILRDASGSYWLTDFGLSKAMMSTGLTSHTGAVLGTPPYIAPEVWLGEPAVPATDQYALACVIYEALTGQVLFSGPTPPAVMTNHLLKGPLGLETPSATLEVSVQATLRRALSKDPAWRFASCSEFAAALNSPSRMETAKPAAPPAPIFEKPLQEPQPAPAQIVTPEPQPAAAAEKPEAARQMPETETAQPEPRSVKIYPSKATRPSTKPALIAFAVVLIGLVLLAVYLTNQPGPAASAPVESTATAIPGAAIDTMLPAGATFREEFTHDVQNRLVGDVTWQVNLDPNGNSNGFKARQENGALTLAYENGPLAGVTLVSRQSLPLSRGIRYKARLKVSSQERSGQGAVDAFIVGPNGKGGQWWAARCRLGTLSSQDSAQFRCEVLEFPSILFSWEQHTVDYYTTRYAANFDTWYLARIEVNPDTLNLRFYMDDVAVGEFTPPNAADLRDDPSFVIGVGSWRNDASARSINYVDDVLLVTR